MIKNEFRQILSSKISKRCLYVLIGIFLLNLIIPYVGQVLGYQSLQSASFTNFQYTTFSVGIVSHGIPQLIILLILPLWIFMIFCNTNHYIFSSSIKNVYQIRDKNIIKKKILSSALIAFIIFLVIMLISYGLQFIFFHAGKETIYGMVLTENNQFANATPHFGTAFEKWQFYHLTLANLLFSFITALMASLLTLYISVISLFVKKKNSVMIIILGAWLVLFLTNYSVLDVFQMLTEYSLGYYLAAFIKFNVGFIAIIIALKYKVGSQI